ncbi:MAG: putative AP-1 complex subunit gamma-1, partial [Streblomastix strix]
MKLILEQEMRFMSKLYQAKLNYALVIIGSSAQVWINYDQYDDGHENYDVAIWNRGDVDDKSHENVSCINHANHICGYDCFSCAYLRNVNCDHKNGDMDGVYGLMNLKNDGDQSDGGHGCDNAEICKSLQEYENQLNFIIQKGKNYEENQMTLIQKIVTMSQTLSDFALAIRSSETHAQERSVITAESARIRSALKDPKDRHLRSNLLKVVFMHLMGYPAHFGKVEAIKLIASPKYLDKRIGYLVFTVLLDPNDELLTLLPNSIRTDLMSQNNFIVSIALTAVSNVADADMVRQFLPELLACLTHAHSFIRKKAALVAVRAIREDHSFAEVFIPKIQALLSERSHAVVISTCALLSECELRAHELVAPNRKIYIFIIIRALRALLLSSSAGQHSIRGITDPYLQVKLLQNLRVLCLAKPEIPDVIKPVGDILSQIATETANDKDKANTAANAVLYECIHTILSVSEEAALRTLAVTTLMRFLSRRDNNSRYVALSLLSKIVFHDKQIITKYKDIVLKCLGDTDESIRLRALSVVAEMVDSVNIQSMLPHMISSICVSDTTKRSESVQRVWDICESCHPDPRWLVDASVQILIAGGETTPASVERSVIACISATPNEYRQFMAKRLLTYLLIQRSARAYKLIFSKIQSNQTIKGSEDLGSKTDKDSKDQVLTKDSKDSSKKLPIQIPPSEDRRIGTDQPISSFFQGFASTDTNNDRAKPFGNFDFPFAVPDFLSVSNFTTEQQQLLIKLSKNHPLFQSGAFYSTPIDNNYYDELKPNQITPEFIILALATLDEAIAPECDYPLLKLCLWALG